MKKSKQNPTRSVIGILFVSCAIGLAACGSPNWENVYTLESAYPGNGGPLDASTLENYDSSGEPCADESCVTPAPSSSTNPDPVFKGPQANPDPVPWHPVPPHRRQ